MKLQTCFSLMAAPLVVAAGLFTIQGEAQSLAGRVPDSQVEANVVRALGGASDLAGQAIQATTIEGTVTLSGSVRDDAQRTRAEQVVATTPGVQRVVDELTVENVQVAGTVGGPADGSASAGVLQSDGTYAPAETEAQAGQGSALQGAPVQEQAGGKNVQGGVAGEIPPANGPNTDPYGRPLNGQQAEGQYSNTPQPFYPGQPQDPQAGQYPPGAQGRGQQQPPYGAPPPRGAYSGQYGPGSQQGYNQGYGQGQVGGQTVTLPAGTVLQVRVNQHLSSRDVNVGTPFDAMVVNDIVADGQVAIPRGAFVQGTVVDAESSGHLKGRGELGLKLTQITLGGRAYPIASDVFSAHGGDKTIQTVNSAVGLGALGAIFGAVAGGGAGAAIGAGVGGAAGLGASAASGRGDVFIPSEAVLGFRLTQPTQVTTVSQTEMQRLAYGVPAGEGRGPQIVRRYPYPYYGVGPVFYPRYYYRPYGYYRY